MDGNCIRIVGATHHNLKNINVNIPRNQLVVVCGPSGSGKSTLAFDIVYAEGQRRYVESLSAYARQFLPQPDKPAVKAVEGLSPAISLEQQPGGRTPRSTVGTVTEIHDFLRVFYARLGTMHCPACGRPIRSRAADEIIDDIMAYPDGARFMVMAPLVEGQKGTQQDLFRKLKAQGFVRVRVDGAFVTLDEVPELDKNRRHGVDLVVDRLVRKDEGRGRLADAVELALRMGGGRLVVHRPGGDGEPGEDVVFATESVCPACRISMPPLVPQLFSFNSPQGACRRCSGLGTVEYFEPMLIAPNRGLSLASKALLPWASPHAFAKYEAPLRALGERWGFDLSTPLNAYPEEALRALFHGERETGVRSGLRRNRLGGTVQAPGARDGDAAEASTAFWPGVVPLLEKGMQYGGMWRDILSRYLQSMDCPECHGSRLRPESLAVTVDGLSMARFCAMPAEQALRWLEGRSFAGRLEAVAAPLVKELRHRLSFLVNVGLDYIAVGRAMNTLSGGEAQRIRLASQLGTGLVGVTYVLDEPSIGLHPRDNARLIGTLRDLQARGNTVLVVEHDDAMIRASDTVIEMGPESGSKGGEVVFHGSFADLVGKADTLTAKYMRGDLSVPVPSWRRAPRDWLTLKGVRTNNLKGMDVRFPLGTLTCVTGVSGSGKSSLVVDSLYKHLALAGGMRVDQPGRIDGIDGAELVKGIVSIDQTPIGRTPRSNPATYTKIFDEIRAIFAMTPDAKRRGYKPGRFSFNVKGGRCEACAGDGQLCVEMHFLPDVYVTCDVCGGRRYNHETLEVRYKGLNIAEVLDLTVSDARRLFSAYPALERRLGVLESVGLGYVRLGQAATTLSGGEAQRIKISRELGRQSLPGMMYVLDEPTTGLHMHEVVKLLAVLHRLVDLGATVVLIEHNADAIMSSDYVIDLGPGGGEAGGSVVAAGTPEEIMGNPASVTGSFLAARGRAGGR